MPQGLAIYDNQPVDIHANGVFDELNQQNFIATKILPNNPALDPFKGKIYSMSAVTDQLSLKPTSARDRGNEVSYKETAIDYDTKAYKTIAFVDPDKIKRMVDPATARLRERQNAVVVASRAERVRMEYLASQLFFSSNFDGSNPSTQWSTTTTSKPRKDLNALAYQIGIDTGMPVNTIIFGHLPWRDFASNDGLLSSKSILKDQTLTQEQALSLLRTGELEQVENIFVGRASYTSSNPNQTLVRVSLWGNEVWLGWLDLNPNSNTLMSAAVAKYEMGTNSMGDQSYVQIREFTTDDTDKAALFIEAKTELDYIPLWTKLGRRLTNVSAS